MNSCFYNCKKSYDTFTFNRDMKFNQTRVELCTIIWLVFLWQWGNFKSMENCEHNGFFNVTSLQVFVSSLAECWERGPYFNCLFYGFFKVKKLSLYCIVITILWIGYRVIMGSSH